MVVVGSGSDDQGLFPGNATLPRGEEETEDEVDLLFLPGELRTNIVEDDICGPWKSAGQPPNTFNNPTGQSVRPPMQITRYPLPHHVSSYSYSPSPYSPTYSPSPYAPYYSYYGPFSPAPNQYQVPINPMLYPLPPRPPPPASNLGGQQGLQATRARVPPGGPVQPPAKPEATVKFETGNGASTATSSLPPPPFPQAESHAPGPSQPAPLPQPDLQPSPQQREQEELHPAPDPSQHLQEQLSGQPSQQQSQLQQEPQSQPQPLRQPPRQESPKSASQSSLHPATQAQAVAQNRDDDNNNQSDIQPRPRVHAPNPGPNSYGLKRTHPPEDTHNDEYGDLDTVTSRSSKKRSVEPSGSATSSVHRLTVEAQDARDAMIQILLEENKTLRAQLSDMRRLEQEYRELTDELAGIRKRLERGMIFR
ncbi:hypothetical protein V8F20_009348 [Naviculisporaceae sp. PSN 640]